MAMNVKFLKGTLAQYTAATKNENTFYYLTDKKALYLGENLIGDGVSLEQFSALEARVKTLEDWKTALPEYVTKAVYDAHLTAQDARDDGQDELIAGLRKDLDDITEVGGEPNKVDDVKVNGTSVVVDKIANIDISGKLDVSTYNTDKQAQTEKDAAQDKALTDYKAEMVETLKGYQTTIQAETYDAFGSAATAEQNAKDYTDAEITGLEFALSDDGKELSLKNKAGTAVATLNTAQFVKDGMISSVAISADGTELVITWNTDAGISATEIPLTELVDVMTGVDGTTITVNVSADDKISAEVKTGSLKDGHIASDAAIAKGKLAADVQASLSKADTALQSHQSLDHKADKVASATAGHFAGLDANGNLTDSGSKAADFATAAQGAKADSLDTWKTELATETSITATESGPSGFFQVTVKTKDGKVSGVEIPAADELYNAFTEKQDSLSADQLLAVNSGISATWKEGVDTAIGITLPKAIEDAEDNAKAYVDGLLAALCGAASADVTIEALVKAINKCIKGTEETTLQTASLTDNINNLDSRADAIEGVLTWGEIK